MHEAEAVLGPATLTLASSMLDGHADRDVASLVSAGRFESYLQAAGGDRERATALYEWNVALSAACFEAFHYVEVVVRNALDREMRTHMNEGRSGIPWFLLPVVSKHEASFQESVERVRRRLRAQSRDRETRDQIIAGVDFGFWTSLLHSENEELWRHALHRAFPHSSGKRKDVVATLEALRVFRNRLAHHDSLLAVDVVLRLDQMKQVLGWVDADAEGWLAGIERVTTLHRGRPAARRDTVVVAARNAWHLYHQVGAYVCQAGRAFQPVEYLAFYADREIKPEVAAIRRRLDNIDWSEAEANRLRSSGNEDQRLSEIILISRQNGWTSGRHQVFELSRPGDPDHLTLSNAVPNLVSGKGSAFTQGQRYVVRDALRRASSTAELV